MKKLEYRTRTGSKSKTTSKPKRNDNKPRSKNVNVQKANVQKVNIPKENINVNNRVNKSSKRVKKSRKKLKMIIFFIVIFAFAILGYLLFTLSVFDISNIEVTGTSRYTSDEVIEKANIKTGRNIFWQGIKGVSKDISTLPYIKTAKISFTLPSKIKVEVVERTFKYFAFDKEKNVYYRIDDDGVIMEQVDIKEKEADELLVYGFIFDDEVVFGTKLKDIDLNKLKVFNNISKEFENSGISGKLTQVNFENSLTTVSLNDKLNVIFPNDTDIKYNMNVLKEIIAKIGEDAGGFVDLTKSSPTYSSF